MHELLATKNTWFTDKQTNWQISVWGKKKKNLGIIVWYISPVC